MSDDTPIPPPKPRQIVCLFCKRTVTLQPGTVQCDCGRKYYVHPQTGQVAIVI